MYPGVVTLHIHSKQKYVLQYHNTAKSIYGDKFLMLVYALL